MSDSIDADHRFRTFTMIDEFNRERLHIEIHTSVTAKSLILVGECICQEQALPETLGTGTMQSTVKQGEKR